MAERRYEHAPAHTLPGLLQRGRGLGARMAQEDPAAAAELVYGCIRWEWRWDRQADDRALYLARLVRDLALPLGPVVELLAAGADACERATRVLELLALDGSAQAREALRGYVRDGEHWQDVLESVAAAWPVEWWDDLAGMARERLRGRDRAELWGEPWDRWGLAGPRPVRGPRGPKPLAEVDNAGLLRLLADPGETEERRTAALDVIDDRGPEPGVIPLVPSLGKADGKHLLWPLIGVVEKLGALAVPDAREWARAEKGWLAGLGYGVLAGHGTVQDTPVLVARLERDWVERRWCGPKRTAEGLRRFGPGAGEAVSLLRRFWLWTPHSYERAAYLEALAAIDPTGLDAVYPECLWDCEADARLLGIAHAPDGPGIGGRLAYLRDDPMEEPEVRAAAGERLAALSG
ncbi:hypothetical protein ACGFZP_02435 [Kitasatospora sp. NPDC048239]|uniref:hypothetical protein n=1 Tax=Kitasatospora sp. NPDC048239 TaxID=3364046 RepID=UPI0037219721